jgi:predicted AlkP superfamily pyrophosphatase or phosphodiesterase
MRNVIIVCIVCLLIAGSVDAKSLIIVGWDGAGYNNVIPMLNDGSLPNLSRLLLRGMFSKYEPVSRTETIPQWTAMFTGLDPSQSGVRSNKEFISAPFGLPYNKTIMKRLQEQGIKVGWFVSKPDYYLWNLSPLRSVVARADGRKAVTPSRGDLGSRVVDDKDYINKLLTAALQFMLSNKDYILFIHLNPDVYGHAFGENHPRYLQEFINCDKALGEIMDFVDVYGIDAKLIVVSDHGFDEGAFTHYRAPDCWFATDLPIKSIYKLMHLDIWEEQETRGTTKDIAYTIWDYFGITDWRGNPSVYRGKSLLQMK